MDVKDITEFKEYHGVNVSVMAYLDKTEVPVSIDIGFGDVIYPDRVKMEFPVLLDMEVPEIYAYSITSVISEKFEAIVSLGDANSRYGYYGITAPWIVDDLNLVGGSGQLETIFSWGTLCDSGLITDTGTAEIH